jgi:hypothetical protein
VIIFIDLATDNIKVSRTLTTDYIWGGIATYLLIGLTFASLFHLIELIAPGSFFSRIFRDHWVSAFYIL